MLLLITALACPEPEYIDPPGKDKTTDDSPTDSERYHPLGFEEPEVHGVEAKQQTQVCVDCHGMTLEGEGAALSCDTCHPSDWRTDCTYCHGGQDNETGAPPLHISGTDEGQDSTFAPHSAHVQDTAWHAAFACSQCHVTPEGPLSEGHLFIGDSTPGKAETDFSAGYATNTVWAGQGACQNVYCHGNGADREGEKGHIGDLDSCGQSCHWTEDFNQLPALNGEHSEHLDRDVACSDCHQGVVGSDNAIVDIALHVNGSIDVELVEDLGWDGNTCSGACHGEQHDAASWE